MWGKKWASFPFKKNTIVFRGNNGVILSEQGDLMEAARNLFAGMRRLDSQPLDVILAELLPERDLGRAINDRLRRAAGG